MLDSLKNPIDGYYTRRIDGVLFTFQDKHFDRKDFIPNYKTQNVFVR